MALPTKDDMQDGAFSEDGTPFYSVASKPGIETLYLEYSEDGTPFWSIIEESQGPEFIPTIIWFF